MTNNIHLNDMTNEDMNIARSFYLPFTETEIEEKVAEMNRKEWPQELYTCLAHYEEALCIDLRDLELLMETEEEFGEYFGHILSDYLYTETPDGDRIALHAVHDEIISRYHITSL